jgi:hypothetical protein
MVKILSPIVIGIVLNQSFGHGLLGEALHFVITKMHEMRDEVANVVVYDNMGDLEVNLFDVVLEELMVCMKCQVLKVFQPFFFFCMGLIRKGLTICWL